MVYKLPPLFTLLHKKDDVSALVKDNIVEYDKTLSLETESEMVNENGVKMLSMVLKAQNGTKMTPIGRAVVTRKGNYMFIFYFMGAHKLETVKSITDTIAFN